MLPRRYRVGCVSFLNARPLIDGLDGHAELDVRYDVPSNLLEDLLGNEVEIALCPVVDYQLSDEPLCVVPVGGIGSDGPTLTVRLFSRVPIEQIKEVHADTDSHTSVVLTKLVLHDLHGIRPPFLPLGLHETWNGDSPQTLLLIGDKVVRNAPPQTLYPHQLDLGGAWKELTGLPFVFAVWMAKVGTDLGPVPGLLDEQRQANATRIEAIVSRWAERAGFTPEVATQYLGRILRYTVGAVELRAMQRFWSRAHELKLLPRLRPLKLYHAADQPVHEPDA